MNTQKGSTSAAVILLVILVVIGIGWWWGQNNSVNRGLTTNTSTTTGYTYTFDDPKTSTTTVTKTITYETPVRQVVTQVASPAAAGTTFRDSTGLRMGFPVSWAGYRTYEVAGGPNNLPGVKRIYFVAPGESSPAFVVNVFTLEQWRNIKNQENFAHLNTPSLGEGTYMGVNFTYAYSSHIFSHQDVANTIVTSARF